ncbi:MAG: FHA domain-containing protein [Bacteroidales bacterium]|nr:FHA domain-containing protein [Bacteroidales bacterium]
MKRIFRYILPVAAALTLSACQSDFMSHLGVSDPTSMFDASGLPGSKDGGSGEKMVVKEVKFAPDYKTFSVWTSVVGDIGPYSLTDSTSVRIDVEEYDDGVLAARRVNPRLVKAWNTESDQIAELGMKVLVLVDLSLSDEQIEAEHAAIEEMFTVLNRSNLYVAFMSDKSVSKTHGITDYILKEYFRNNSSKVYLYRSISTKLQEISERKEPWADASEIKLVVFSDGRLYGDGDVPLDAEHFKIENDLLHSEMPDSVSICYVNFAKKAADAADDSDATNLLTSVCQSTGGEYFPAFSWPGLEAAMLGEHGDMIVSNRFDFVNPDRKVYRGDNNQLKLIFYSLKEKRQIASATASIREGSLYKPIIVNGDSLKGVIIQGVSIGLIIMLLLYLILQFIVPYVKYRLFLRKYVVRHTGRDMVIGDTAVAESCYLCKEPFKEGDEVVVKCAHTMHKSCWDENEYHCPEYGRHCKEGSHFYDREHLSDRRNAPFYMNWLLMGILMSVCAWVALSIWTNFTSKHILEYLIPVDYLTTDKNGTHLNQLPSYGLLVGFFLTAGICLMSIRKKHLLSWLDILLRSTVAGAISSLLYLLVSLACIALHLEAVSFILNLIPWILSGYLTAVIATLGTRIKLKKTIILIAAGVSILSMYLWYSCYMLIGIDFRVLLLFSIMIYDIGIMLAIATAAPRSEHYFLHAQGAVKTMDIAIYKWFRANPNAVVSIGKSVDCSLQVSWDLQSKIAPVHAEITMKKGVLRLMALEEGVTVGGKPLKVDKYQNLYHGTTFQIGKTTFTYEEKDI